MFTKIKYIAYYESYVISLPPIIITNDKNFYSNILIIVSKHRVKKNQKEFFSSSIIPI